MARTFFIHETANCFVCLQYLHSFSRFCAKHQIEIVFSNFAVGVILIDYCNGTRKIFIEDTLSRLVWMPSAFDVLGLPAETLTADNSAHCNFSLN